MIDISVVIPCKGPDWRLELTLDSLAAQSHDRDRFEVIVVDDHNEPPYVPAPRHDWVLVERLGGDEPWGRSAGCAAGARAAHGAVVLWLDADCIAPPTLLADHLAFHEAMPWAAGVGPLIFSVSMAEEDYPDHDGRAEAFSSIDRFVEWVDGLDTSEEVSLQEKIWAQTSRGRRWSVDAFRMFTGACGSMPRALYAATGGFDPDLKLGEDTEMAYRIEQSGGRVALVDGRPVLHVGSPTTTHQLNDVRRFNDPYLSQRIPKPMYRRLPGAGRWRCPVAVVQLVGAGDEDRLCTTEQLLQGARADIAIVAPPAPSLPVGRSPLSAPELTQALVGEWLAGDPRVIRSSADVKAAFEVVINGPIDVGARSLSHLVAMAESEPFDGVDVQVCDRHGASVSIRWSYARNRTRALRDSVAGAEITHEHRASSVSADEAAVACRACAPLGQYSSFTGLVGEAVKRSHAMQTGRNGQ